MNIGRVQGPFLLLTFLFVSLIILTGLGAIPFHPDESSLLYQSRDLESLFEKPFELGWREGWQSDPDQTYRALNAPLAKYVLGIGRLAAGFPNEQASVDWDWSLDWDQNSSLGALPPERLLLGARVASALAVLGAVVVTFMNGMKLDGKLASWSAGLFLGINSLALLHGRRAMAEGVLLFTVALAFYGFILADRRPWFAGVTTALAFSSKYSVAPLILVGLLATQITTTQTEISIKARLRVAFLYLGSFTAVVLLLHPFLWTQPVEAVQAMISARGSLLTAQAFELSLQAPNQILQSWPLRLAVLTAHLFITPLQFYEIGNYITELKPAIDAYLKSPLSSLLRNPTGGGITMALALLGLSLSLVRWRTAPTGFQRGILILAFTTLIQMFALVAVVPLPFQRFAMPLLPILALWIGLAFSALGSALSESQVVQNTVNRFGLFRERTVEDQNG